jgi:sterol 3beta-glucosyltransferase
VRIAVVAVGTRGDVEPHIALCHGLRSAGFRVTLVAPLDFRSQAPGLNFHPIQISFRTLCDTPAGTALLATSRKSIRFLFRLRQLAVPVAQQIFSDIGTACREADAVCYSPLGFPAHYFARDLGIPSIPTGLQPIGRTRAYPAPLFPLGPRTPGVVNRLSYLVMEQAFWQLLRPLMKAQGHAGTPFFGHFSDMYKNGPMLFAYSAAVVPRPADWTSTMHTTGFWHLPTDETWTPPSSVSDFLSSGPPPVCVGFGSMQNREIERIVDVTLQALAALGMRAIVLTGWSGLAPHRISSRPNVCVTESIPHSWLFPKVATVVSHGGAGTTAAALRAGVPSTIVPFFFDQTFWGRWLRQRGLGPDPIPHPEVSVEAMVRALEHAANCQSLRNRIQCVRQSLLQEDGVGNAVSLICRALERHLAGRRGNHVSNGALPFPPFGEGSPSALPKPNRPPGVVSLLRIFATPILRR